MGFKKVFIATSYTYFSFVVNDIISFKIMKLLLQKARYHKKYFVMEKRFKCVRRRTV